MKKLVVTGALAFMVLNFVACDSGYVEETRKPNDYIAEWNRVEKGIKAGEITLYTPKSYKSEKANTQPPYMILMSVKGEGSGAVFEPKRSDEVQSIKVNGGKCEIGESQKREIGLAILLKCPLESVSKIEIETNAGKFTYKF